MPNTDELEYTDSLSDALEVVWEKGFLSPGGAKKMGLKLEEVEISHKRVPDLDAADVVQRIKVVSVFPLRCQPETEVGNKQWNK